MEKILRTIEKFIPKKIYSAGQPIYHYLLALIAAIFHKFPAKKLFIIGVTGTKGKSTTTEIINAILEEAGYKTALSNTIRFKIDKNSTPNKYKMSMPGRFFIQDFLHQAVKAGCTHAVVEISSEGAKQFRHKFIWLDAFVFTNLAPEHIESHGSYEKYREAKLKIADNVVKKNGIVVVNGDDEEAQVFLDRTNVTRKIKFSLSDAKPISYSPKTEFRFKRNTLYAKLPGEFNVYNMLAGATVADAIGIEISVIKKALENLNEVPGRAQKVSIGPEQKFDVIVDYAHTAESLEELYKAFPNKRKICILGNTGGGRDKWKRPIMASIADKYCDDIILTNEDPYDEDPMQIINEMLPGFTKKQPKIIMDRRDAIKTAITTAGPENVILISGKGTDPYIMEANNTKTPWSDYEVAKEELEKNFNKAL